MAKQNMAGRIKNWIGLAGDAHFVFGTLGLGGVLSTFVVGVIATVSELPWPFLVLFWVSVFLLVVAGALWFGKWWRARRDEPSERLLSQIPPSPPSVGRIGYVGRSGSTGNLSDAQFGEKLDRGIDNEGEVDARRARFGVRDEDDKDKDGEDE